MHGRQQASERGWPVTRKRWPKAVLLTSVVALGAGGVTVAAQGLGGSDNPAASRPDRAAPATSAVSRSNLSASTLMPGELGYGEPVTVEGRMPGTITWLPGPGTTVSRGQKLYEVDTQPVSLMYGSTPMYRDLKQGVEGPDVEQLNSNLRALGYEAPDSDEYTWQTTAAVRAWQEKKEMKETGEVKKGQILFTAGAVRVAGLEAAVGGPATGKILTRSDQVKSVSVSLEIKDRDLVKKGAKVDVLLPGGRTVAGTVKQVQTVIPPGDDGPQGGGQGEKPKTKVAARIEIADQKALTDLDAATVDVKFTKATAEQALSVPVTALVALTDGGYGVEAVENGTVRRIPVKIGLFAQGRVEITGDGLREGMNVVVPQ
ncbi:peptidoglycan-binding protein [Streptomyces microflavus]|uniref:peptidoglycan-binding protein n=1 Tax=Streptomyces microflavus TaxID=1919 RepID=UPI00381C5C1A